MNQLYRKLQRQSSVYWKKSLQLQKSLELLEKAFKTGSDYDKAIAIFHLIIACYDDDILWTIVESLCSNMTNWDWIVSVASIVATIVAAGETGGAAFVAKIVLALASAYEFFKKFDNLSELKAM